MYIFLNLCSNFSKAIWNARQSMDNEGRCRGMIGEVGMHVCHAVTQHATGKVDGQRKERQATNQVIRAAQVGTDDCP